MAAPLILFAPGAGASSSSKWMHAWTKRLGRIAKVASFDYPYMIEGRKLPDRHDKLIAAHFQALSAARKRLRRPIVLAGKSMGGRMSCHVALEQSVDAVICLGYPLVGMSGKVRDDVLLSLTTPVLFVQGTRDKMCPLDHLARVRKRMKARSSVHVVETGDHSLLATKTWLKDNDSSQGDVDQTICGAIASFLSTHAS